MFYVIKYYQLNKETGVYELKHAHLLERGGCAHRRAKQVWYAVIKIDDAD